MFRLLWKIVRLSIVIAGCGVVSLGCLGDVNFGGRVTSGTVSRDARSVSTAPQGTDVRSGDVQIPVSDAATPRTSSADSSTTTSVDSSTSTVDPGPCRSGGWGTTLINVKLDGKVVSTPAVLDDGTIIVATLNASLYAIDCRGKQLWKWKFPCTEKGSCPQAFEGSPLLGPDDTIYQGDDIAIPNYLFALTPQGALKWSYKTQTVYGQMDSSPVWTTDGTLFIGTKGVSGWSGSVGRLFLFDAEGKMSDRFPVDVGASVTSPAGVGNTIIIPTEVGRDRRAELRAINTQGTELWKIAYSSEDGLLGSVAIDHQLNASQNNQTAGR